jgi:hypothetical protein
VVNLLPDYTALQPRRQPSSHEILVGKHEGSRPFGRLGVDGRIILKWMLRKLCGKVWTGFIWLRIGASNEPSTFKSGVNFLAS